MWLSLKEDSGDIDMELLDVKGKVGAVKIYGDSQRLTPSLLAESFKRTRYRLIILDYGGTLIPREAMGTYIKAEFLGTRNRSITPEMKQNLINLCNNPHNKVFVISGNTMDVLMKALGDISGLGLLAEGGLHMSWPVMEGSSSPRTWQSLRADDFVGGEEAQWRKISKTIMQHYEWRTNGSYIRETGRLYLCNLDPIFCVKYYNNYFKE